MKQLIKSLIRSLGYDVRKYRPSDSLETLVAHMLRERGIRTVLDVGANEGQFAEQLRAEGYDGRILSFEPLAGPHAALSGAAQHDPNWTVADRMAIGDEDGEIEINRSGNSVSSSILDILPAHTAAAPASVYEGTERVPIHRLDTLWPDWVGDEAAVFLKLDVQGYEDRVLTGAQGVLPAIAGIQTELSLLPLYEGQVLHEAMLARLNQQGYELYALWGGYANPRSGRMLQYDVLCMRPQ